MVSQTLAIQPPVLDTDDCCSGCFDIQGISTPLIFLHLVTLVKRSTGEEVCLKIETFSDRFSDVMREVNYQRSLQKLVGYEYFEALDCNQPPF